MVQAIGAIGQYNDSEYLWIIQQLQKYGLSPSGNKAVDKARLAQTQKEEEEKSNSQYSVQQTSKTSSEQQTEREQLEEERPGALKLAELNKILLGL